MIPFVSICTPTFNRRPFIPALIHCIEAQTYPRTNLEWIILDDGTDLIEDLVTHLPYVKYIKSEKRSTLGEKRNEMHSYAQGDILVYMDDDDYYPPRRISHAVEMLQLNPDRLIAGASEMYIFFKHIHKLMQFGPYGANHATAATFAFRKELLSSLHYDNKDYLGEETFFLKNYSIPMIQLDPVQTILVISHNHNSFDKKLLLDNPNKFINETTKTVDDFFQSSFSKHFFMNEIDTLLQQYEPGMVNKKDILHQMEVKQLKRQLDFENKNKSDIVKMLTEQNIYIQELQSEIKVKAEKIIFLEQKITEIINKLRK